MNRRDDERVTDERDRADDDRLGEQDRAERDAWNDARAEHRLLLDEWERDENTEPLPIDYRDRVADDGGGL